VHQGGELVKWFGGETWRRINKMDSDVAQMALVTVCRYVQDECRDRVITLLRKQRRNANQRTYVARRKFEQLELEVAFLRMVNRCLLEQLRRERTLREAERTLRGR
jgi:hypothetical protein